MDLHDLIPALIHISDGRLHDVNVLDIMPVEAGAFYVMDRGYPDFERLYATHQAAAFFVTRAKAGMDAQRVYSAPLDRNSGVICDQRIMLNGFYSAKHDPEHLRACSKCYSIIKNTPFVIPNARAAGGGIRCCAMNSYKQIPPRASLSFGMTYFSFSQIF